MKHLLLLFFFSGYLDSFSQDGKTDPHSMLFSKDSIGFTLNRIFDLKVDYLKSDTLRCTLIVYYDNGPTILHTKPGFVVRRWWGDNLLEVYLDDRKKVVKAPWEVLTYKIKK